MRPRALSTPLLCLLALVGPRAASAQDQGPVAGFPAAAAAPAPQPAPAPTPGAPDEAPAPGTPAAEPAAPPPPAPADVDPITVLEVPTPDLATLEGAVAQQLTEMRGILERELARQPLSLPTLAEAYGELGRNYQTYGLDDAAAACYENARRLAPQDPRWPYYLGYLQQSRGQLDDAVAAYVNSLAVAPPTVPALYHLAEVFIERNRPHEARALLERADSSAPDVPAIGVALGRVDLAEQRYHSAAQHFEKALAQVPKADRLHYLLGQAYRGLGEEDKAQAELTAAGSIGVRLPDPLIDQLEELKTGERVHLLRGQQAFRAGDYSAAAEAFRQAVAAQPTSVAAHVNLGSALGRLGDLQSAIAEFHRALELDHDSQTAHFNLGMTLVAAGKADEAIEHLQAAADLEPRDGEAQLQVADTLVKLGRFEEALPRYASAAGLLAGDDRPWLGGAEALLRLGRYQEALDRLEQANKAMPQQGRIAHALARVLAASPDLSLRDGARALELAQAVFAASPSTSHGETVAMALAELGRCEEAAQLEQKVLDAAKGGGDEATATRLAQTLARYRKGAPCRLPGGSGAAGPP
jgi:tetratricopeptide (TPR) repeat protein